MPQYQHYIPQFILRKHTDYVKPDCVQYGNKQEYERAVSKAKKRAKVNILDFKAGFDKGKLERRSCNKTFGMPDMYGEEIETALGALEQSAAAVIEAVELDFLAGKTAMVIARPEKDLLRRFLFIMAYRNRGFHTRFEGRMDDYSSNDRDEMLAYMHRKGIENPRDVWLQNIRAFIDVDLAQDDQSWLAWLQDRAYPSDAKWFWKNMTTSYLCFCTPGDAGDEFILTQNAYGIFEGPSDHQGWLDWHTFAPVNPRLMIVMRNQYLGQVPNLPCDIAEEVAKIHNGIVDSLTACYQNPGAARSWLEDLPVERPVPSYPTERQVSRVDRAPRSMFSPSDTFTFQFFHLPSTFVQRINAIFLEEALVTDAIGYKSVSAFRRALETYLEIEQRGFKGVMQKRRSGDPEVLHICHSGLKTADELPHYKRRSYLAMIERIAKELGSDCVAKFSTVSPRSKMLMPPLPPDFVARYKRLGFDDMLSTWLDDEVQARTISRLWLIANYAVNKKSKEIRQAMNRARVKLISSLHPRRVWLHLRLMRFLVNERDGFLMASRDDYLSKMVAEDNGGPEDVVVDCMSVFSPGGISRAMMRASGMRQYREIRVEAGLPMSKVDYFDMAMCYVGSIADCDVPRLKEAAIEKGRQSDSSIIKAVVMKSGCSVSMAIEIWMRRFVHQDLEAILEGCGLEGDAVKRLKEFLFELLYPLQW